VKAPLLRLPDEGLVGVGPINIRGVQEGDPRSMDFRMRAIMSSSGLGGPVEGTHAHAPSPRWDTSRPWDPAQCAGLHREGKHTQAQRNATPGVDRGRQVTVQALSPSTYLQGERCAGLTTPWKGAEGMQEWWCRIVSRVQCAFKGRD